MKKRIIFAALLAFVVGIGVSAHAQASSLSSSPPLRDAYAGHEATVPAKPSAIPIDAWNYAWSNFIDAIGSAARGLIGASAVASGHASLGEKIFDGS